MMMKNNKNHSNLADDQLWMVSLSAILTEMNGDDIWNLPFGSMDDEKRKGEWRKGLVNSWGIETKDECLEILDWLDSEGHQADYMKLSQQWGHISEEKCEEMLGRYEDDSFKRKIRLLNTHYMTLREVGIYAWDVGRYVHVARCAYFVGLLTEGEAWEKLRYIARKAQPVFNSWHLFGLSYTVGWAYWSSGDLNRKFCEGKFSIMNGILKDMAHPWNILDWSTAI